MLGFGAPVLTELGGACRTYPNLRALVPLPPITTSATGSAGLTLPLPNDSRLLGSRLVAQAALFAPSSPLGYGLSNGSLLVLGR